MNLWILPSLQPASADRAVLKSLSNIRFLGHWLVAVDFEHLVACDLSPVDAESQVSGPSLAGSKCGAALPTNQKNLEVPCNCPIAHSVVSRAQYFSCPAKNSRLPSAHLPVAALFNLGVCVLEFHSLDQSGEHQLNVDLRTVYSHL